MDYDEATQPSTQQKFDPRRLGRNNSGLSSADISDVICILHPSSPAAFRIVANTAQRKPQHVLQNDTFATFDEEGTVDLEEQETFVIDSEIVDNAQDLALRFSSETVQPVLGFCFGRNARTCDIVLDTDSFKRVSNLHFRIFVNPQGVLMLEDMSTNGTLVDEKHLRGKNSREPATRMLQAGSIVQIPSVKKEESIKFIVRIPSRGGFEQEYTNNVRKYLNRLRVLEEQHQHTRPHMKYTSITQPVEALHVSSNPFGMRWNGGDQYNVVGQLGKGAFATVYKLATKMEGKHYAAKELDKRRFIRNGRLDQRLDNEMQIMKTIRHQNVVQYIGYHDHAEHLYIIMEYVPCGDLQGYLLKNKILRETEAKLMSRQVLDALQYLHAKKITHRDIKPDNILIAQQDPFLVKLSDFGLSKIVSTDQTFLKTFCGTLLYCAPEVFPHYEDHMERKGVKRRRSGNAFAPKFHSYSQSVDIWSYAAVLWLAMCERPPFEGVVDQTGKGMFDRIMATRLDINPLLAHGISPQAVDLLCRMLNTDPAQRPTELECLQHPWLDDGRWRSSSQLSQGLLPISEEVKEATTVDGQAQRLSQLSVQDTSPSKAGANRQLSNVAEENEDDDFDLLPEFDSGDLDFINPRESKRVRADKLVPRHHAREQAAIPFSSPELSPSSQQDFQDFEDEDGLPIPGRHSKQAPRLFGEIGHSALESSGLLGEKTNAALDMPSDDTSEHDEATESQMVLDAFNSYQAAQVTSELFRSDAVRYPSLMGTESELRELNMIDLPSHEPNTSGDASDFVDEPQTPKTPDGLSEDNSGNTKSPISQPDKSSLNGTPRQGHVASRVQSSANATPRQEHYSTARTHQIAVPSSLPLQAAITQPSYSSQKPLLGILRSTPDSIDPSIELRLYDRLSHWGRHPNCTFTYPDKRDTRIPKRAFLIWFHAYGIEKAEREGRDWRVMPDIHTVINTDTRTHICINGEKLYARNEAGEQMCGRLFTGDVIEIFTSRNVVSGSQQTLKFVCEFFVGEAEARRPEDRPFVVERGVEPNVPRQSF
jgi:serine/threonine protein kinase